MTAAAERLDTDVRVEGVSARAYTVPTDRPESDGTLEWASTTIVIAEVTAGDVVGLGYTYASAAACIVILDLLHDIVVGRDAMATPAIWVAMSRATRNIGRA